MSTLMDQFRISPLETTRNQIRFIELPERYQENWANDNGFIIRGLACLWGDREAFQLDIIGDANVVGSQSSNISRDLPQEDIEYAGMYAEDLKMVRWIGSPGRDEMTGAFYCYDKPLFDINDDTRQDGLIVYDVTFRKPLYKVLPDESITYEYERYVVRPASEVSAENLSIESRWLRYADPQYQKFEVRAGVPIQLPKRVFCLEWHMVPSDSYPSETVDDMIGKVNSETFEGRAPGTVLFLGDKARKYQSPLLKTFDMIPYFFEYRRQGYNKYFLPSADDFVKVERIRTPGTGPLLADRFSKLFDVSNP